MSEAISLNVVKATETVVKPVFLDIFEDIHGGVTVAAVDLTTDLNAAITEVPAGTLLGPDLSVAGLFHIAKSAVVNASSTGTALKLNKAHLFKAGDFIANDTKSCLISSIVFTDSSFDTLTLATALTVTTNDKLHAGTAAGVDAADYAQKYPPNCILKQTLNATDAIADGVNLTGGAVVRASVDESVLPYTVPDLLKTALTDRIRFA